MDKFRKDRRGAVTVMITLLLIPALLISGTGVDLARMYTAQSIVQDANQMAANAALSQYDAMLQDVYGLFAVASADDELNKMVTDYVNACLYGIDPEDPDSFVVFRGSEATSTCTSTQDLGQVEVLKNQILEYAKFRAPVTIVDELMDRLDQFEKVKADAEVIEEKTALDDEVKDLEEIGEDLKKAIDEANTIESTQGDCVDRINRILDHIHDQFDQMDMLRTEYILLYEKTDFWKDEKLADLELAYDITIQNIYSITDGSGNIHGWNEGYEDDEGEWHPAEKVLEKQLKDCLKDAAKDAQGKMADCIKLLEKVNKECQKFEEKKADIKAKIQSLEKKLESDDVSEQLKTGADGKSGMKKDLNTYKQLLAVDVVTLGQEFYDANELMIRRFSQKVDPEGVVYGRLDQYNTPDPEFSMSIQQLNGVGRNADFDQDALIANKNLPASEKRNLSLLTELAALTKDEYHYIVYPDADKFHEISQKHKDFWDELKKSGSEDDSKSDNAKSNISTLLDAVLAKLEGFTFIPQGAKYYGKDNESEDTGVSNEWSDTDKTMDQAGDAIDQVKTLGEIAAGVVDDVVDKLILVTYDSEMFSCYADGRTDVEDAKPRTSMAGVPVDTHVNYFYQSEMEYLFNGNKESAAANLAAVAGTMVLVRFVFNYIATFSVPQVSRVIENIKAACNFGGPIGAAVGIAIGELARVAFALGESVFDVAELREGDAVPLMKNETTWKLSVTGFAKMAEEEMEEVTLEVRKDVPKDPLSLTYRDYLRIFLLLKDEATLVERTGDLIELNVTNIKNGVYEAGQTIYENEEAMSQKTLFQMGDSDTAYEVTTTVEMRFIFFSMAVFQKGIDGVSPPTTINIKVTDRRGY